MILKIIKYNIYKYFFILIKKIKKESNIYGVDKNRKNRFQEFGVIRWRDKTSNDNEWRWHGFLPCDALE